MSHTAYVVYTNAEGASAPTPWAIAFHYVVVDDATNELVNTVGGGPFAVALASGVTREAAEDAVVAFIDDQAANASPVFTVDHVLLLPEFRKIK